MVPQFYLPEKYLPTPERQAEWKSGHPTVEPGGKAASAHAWIFQTWVALERAGFPTRLVHEVPNEGVVVTLTGLLDPSWSPPKNLFLAGIAADATPHRSASLHILQNSAHARRLPNASFMPHWPQPGLLPRNETRTERFENICFLGDAQNLAGELRDPRWTARLKAQTGLTLTLRDAPHWHDYREVDCVVAIRSFGRELQLRKPATKLYNAWLASVPFIGGSDSAYASDGNPNTNYLAATTPDELIAHLSRLQSDPTLRKHLVEKGRKQSEFFTFAAITRRWIELLGQTIPALITADSHRSKVHRSTRRFANRLAVEWDHRLRG